MAAAVEEDVDLVGLSVLSGSHLAAVPAVLDGLRAAGRADLPVVVGGIIPAGDAETLRAAGVARVFTPKDFALTDIIDELVTVVREANGLPVTGAPPPACDRLDADPVSGGRRSCSRPCRCPGRP